MMHTFFLEGLRDVSQLLDAVSLLPMIHWPTSTNVFDRVVVVNLRLQVLPDLLVDHLDRTSHWLQLY